MEYPKIQVFIMTYNRPETLVAAIDSVLNQTYPNLELVVSDNSTNDETFDKLRSQDSWGKYNYIRRNPPMSGVEHLKTVFDEATSEYFIIFHDDDEMLPDMVENLYDVILRDPAHAAAGANARIIKYGKDSGPAFEKKDVVLADGEALIQRYNTNSIAPFPSYMYHRPVVGNIRPDFEHKGGKYCDVSFLFDVANQGPITYVGKPLMKYYIHKDQDSGSFDFLKHVQMTDYLKRKVNRKDLLIGLRIYHIYHYAVDGYKSGKVQFRPNILRLLIKYNIRNFPLKYLFRYIQSRFNA